MTATPQQLRDTVLLLRNGNPEAFDDFISLINEVTRDALIALSDAPTEEILVHKGRCQQLRWLLQVLKECDKKKPQPPTPQQ